MSKFIITEPAPSSTSFIRSGRGGAGNTFPISALPATTSSAPSPPNASSSRRFFSGIGGAGNAHAANERPPLSLDQEFRSRAAAHHKSSGHCGIGGAGNVYVRKPSNAGSEESIEDDDASSRSSMSSKAKLWARVSGTFARD